MDELKSKLSLLKDQEKLLESYLVRIRAAITATTIQIQNRCPHKVLLAQIFWNCNQKLFSVKCSECAKKIGDSLTPIEYGQLKDHMRNSVFFEK